MGGKVFLATVLMVLTGASVFGAEAPARKTRVDIREGKFLINGEPTLKGKSFDKAPLEGLLPNARMVQGIFDDENAATRTLWAYPDGKAYDADRNTAEFIAAMPAWREHGLLAFTINLQGGSPQGYSKDQPWINSALDAAGGLKPAYMARLEKILDKADELGMVAILGYYYFGQEPRMKDEAAVVAGTKAATEWVVGKGYTNVIVEVANECDNKKYKHAIIGPARMPELIEVVKAASAKKVKNAAGRLLVSTSFNGPQVPKGNVVAASDFVLVHGNGAGDSKQITVMVEKIRKLPEYKGQPIVFNEDDHFDFDKPANNFVAATRAGASWGYFDFRKAGEKFEDGYQCLPTDWTIDSERKRGFFGLLKKMTAGE